MAEERADGHLDRRGEDTQLVDHWNVGRVGDDDHERFPLSMMRHESVAQHQIGRNRPKQLLVDPEVVHVDEFSR